MKFEENPLDAVSLVTPARSDDSYDLPDAMANLVVERFGAWLRGDH